MKTPGLFLLLLAACFNAVAQLEFNVGNTQPDINTTITTVEYPAWDDMNISSAGTGLVWDFSNLNFSYSLTSAVNVVSISILQDECSMDAAVSGANIATTSYMGPPVYVTTIYYYEYSESYNRGWGGSQSGICTVLDEPYVNMVFPFQLQDIINVDDHTMHFSATGTLIAKGVTHENVALIRTNAPLTQTQYEWYEMKDGKWTHLMHHMNNYFALYEVTSTPYTPPPPYVAPAISRVGKYEWEATVETEWRVCDALGRLVQQEQGLSLDVSALGRNPYIIRATFAGSDDSTYMKVVRE